MLRIEDYTNPQAFIVQVKVKSGWQNAATLYYGFGVDKRTIRELAEHTLVKIQKELLMAQLQAKT